MNEVAPPRISRRRALLITVAGLTVAGALVGALWAWLAPPIHGVVALTKSGERVKAYLGNESDHFFVAAFRLALPRTMLRFAGGREITLGDLGAKKGILGGINAVIVGNYLTTLGRPAEADLELLDDLQMPIKALNASL